MSLKDYQQTLLDDYAVYLSRVREVGPDRAFRESTRQHFGFEVAYFPLPGAPEVPYVCLRVPTGGGKTMIGGHAIKRVNDSFLASDSSLILWLVPSEAIRDQTLYVLKTPGELLHDEMRELFGKVNVLDINEALYVTPATLATANTIIVSTMQSFKRDSPDGLRVYRQNGSLMSHFSGKTADGKGECSLLDVIRLHCPFVIVDEAHNQGTALAIDTLIRFKPSCVLELTATPDRAINPSNVFRSISAATLQAEDMLKLPLEVALGPDWQPVMTEAINRLRELEKDAEAERSLTGENIDPVVMLIQGESARQGHETFTPPVIKQHLIDDFQIPAEKIAIEYRDLNELEGKRLGDPDFPQFVITVDKLREGWDCPFAYVLFSFRSTTSATAVEQVLGRILRMPHVRRKQTEALNRSYAYAVSVHLVDTVKSLKDGLVQSGFERIDTNSLITVPQGDSTLFAMHEDVSVPLPVENNVLVMPDVEKFASLPNALRSKIDISPETGTLTVRDGVTTKQIRLIASTFSGASVQKSVQTALDTKATTVHEPKHSPAEAGEKAAIPKLMYSQGGLFEFDETVLLDADWEIDEFDEKLTNAEFAKDTDALRRAALSISQLGSITIDPYERLDSELALFDTEAGWDHNELVYWLDRNIQFPYADRGQKVAWINAAVNYLVRHRSISIDELAYRKFRLRGALEAKLKTGLVIAKQRVFRELVANDQPFVVRDEYAFIFEQGRYAYDYPYSGVFPLKRHFFPVIGNLKAEGEEFNCAQEIANDLPNVKWWIRNVERKQQSFWLQTASDKFYPDFLIRLYTGVNVAVEYKGAHLGSSEDSLEKRQLGELWARRSGGKCRFAWVENENWDELKAVVAD